MANRARVNKKSKLMTHLTTEFVNLDGRLPVEFWASMPATKPPYELIEGELKRKQLKRQKDVYASCQLAFRLFLWGQARNWNVLTAGFGLRADNWNGFVPDAMAFAPDSETDADAVYTNSAFLVADVIWGTTAPDRDAKKRGYAHAKVELYLLVDANQKQIEVYRLNGDAYGAPEVLSSHAVWQPAELDGLQLDLAKLWL